MSALIEARNLSCGYQGTVIFKDLNFKLHPGQFSALVGPSGTGKTTLIKALLGLVQPWAGQLYYHGQLLRSDPLPGRPHPWLKASEAASGANIYRPQGLGWTAQWPPKLSGTKLSGKVRPRIGYVPQVETVDWSFPVTAAEVVMMGCYRPGRLLPWPSPSDRRRAYELLARMGAAGIAHQAIGALSGGQQQRVFLARALMGDPDLLLLDEPTSSADIQTQHELLHLLWDLNDRGVTILLSTHDLNAVATHLPWVVCFNHGIVAQGRPVEVLTSETLRQTFGGDMVIQRQGDHVLIASRATAISHPVERPRPALLTAEQRNIRQREQP